MQWMENAVHINLHGKSSLELPRSVVFNYSETVLIVGKFSGVSRSEPLEVINLPLVGVDNIFKLQMK